MVPFLDKGLQWVNVKQKPSRQIQAYSGVIRHIQGLFRHIQAYSEPCITLAYLETWYIQNLDIFRTRSIFRNLAYSQFWYIHKAGIIQTPEAYSEPCQTSTLIITFTSYNYFRSISLLRSLLHEINMIFLIQV